MIDAHSPRSVTLRLVWTFYSPTYVHMYIPHCTGAPPLLVRERARERGATVHCTSNLERVCSMSPWRRRANYNATRMLNALSFPASTRWCVGNKREREIILYAIPYPILSLAPFYVTCLLKTVEILKENSLRIIIYPRAISIIVRIVFVSLRHTCGFFFLFDYTIIYYYFSMILSW